MADALRVTRRALCSTQLSKRLGVAISVLILIGLTFVLAMGLENKNTGDSKSAVEHLSSRKSREFQLKSVLDPKRELTQDIFKGKVTILNVWASWCGPCRAEQETLLALSKHSSSPVAWLGLNINDSLAEAQRMLQIYGNPYQDVIYDPEGRLAIHLGIRGTPALLILDEKGGIHYRHYGPINQAIWKEEIEPVLKHLQEAQQ